jgi:hypothetical protein
LVLKGIIGREGMFLGGAVVAFDESVILTGWLNGKRGFF